MSSSISSSDAADRAAWKHWLAVFLITLVATFVAIWTVVLFVDPYDAGRFYRLPIVGIADENPRTASASRGRDPQFNAAVFGNSTGQLLDPKELSQLTGLSFVQLTVPGTGPREQLTLLRWFTRHHQRVGALVIVADETWCTGDASLRIRNPFPFWLYSESDLEYLRHSISSTTAGRALRRAQLALGLRPRSEPNGYRDYEIDAPRVSRPEIRPWDQSAAARYAGPKEFFPAIRKLEEFLATLALEIPVVIVMPPVFFTLVPPSETPAAARLTSCKAALASVLANRPRSNFLDFRLDDATTRDPGNFVDHEHYRAGVARRVEQDIARSIRSGRAARADF